MYCLRGVYGRLGLCAHTLRMHCTRVLMGRKGRDNKCLLRRVLTRQLKRAGNGSVPPIEDRVQEIIIDLLSLRDRSEAHTNQLINELRVVYGIHEELEPLGPLGEASARIVFGRAMRALRGLNATGVLLDAINAFETSHPFDGHNGSDLEGVGDSENSSHSSIHLFKRLAHLVTSRTTAMADSQAMTTTTPIVTPSVPPPTKRIKLGDNESADNKTSGDGSDGSDHSVADNTWRSKLDRNFDERDVGISEFIGDYKPFEAVLKNRYEDFLVHEIAKNGQILRLIDNRMPEEEVIPVLDIYEVFDDNTIDKIRQLVDKTSSDSTGDVSSDKVVDECVVNTNADQTDETIDAQTVATTTVTTGAVDDRKDADNKDTKNGDKNCVKIPVNGLSKHERTRIHKAIKDNYEDLETSTVDDTDGHKYIVVKRVDKGSAPARNRHQWPKHKGEYIHFVMYKENRETQQALNELALKMRISAKNFAIAGTKDKRAITTQAVSAWKVPPQRIWYAARGCRDIEVGHFQFAARELRLGELCGNRFDIVLRDVKCSDRSDAERSLQSVATIGAINYYGMQRFGFKDNYEDLETSTVDDTDGHKYIVVKRVDKGSAPARNRHQWPKHRGEYIHFVMYKENRETQQALNELALKMRISAKNFAIAGTKDKRAITTQAVSAWKVPPQRIWYAARGCRDIEVGHFQFAARELRLGELSGNRFDIVLRDVKCSDRSDAERSLQSVATIGAINYY
ncbi:unnamed protein product, partial [Medioppia subpectinata]